MFGNKESLLKAKTDRRDKLRSDIEDLRARKDKMRLKLANMKANDYSHDTVERSMQLIDGQIKGLTLRLEQVEDQIKSLEGK